MEPDEDLSLIKDIIINKVETLSKYKSRFKNKIVIFTGNRFENSGIAFLAEFAISICKDAGESSLANKVELGSKAIVISMSIPIIHNLLEIILNLMPN